MVCYLPSPSAARGANPRVNCLKLPLPADLPGMAPRGEARTVQWPRLLCRARPAQRAIALLCSPEALQPRGSAAQRLCSPEALQPGGSAAQRLCSPEALQPGGSAARRLCSPEGRARASARAPGASGRGLAMAGTTRVGQAGAPADGMCAQVDADVTPSG